MHERADRPTEEDFAIEPQNRTLREGRGKGEGKERKRLIRLIARKLPFFGRLHLPAQCQTNGGRCF